MSETDLQVRQAEIAKRLAERPLSLKQIEAMEGIVGIQASNAAQVNAVMEVSAKAKSGTESVEIDPRLVRYHGMYERWTPEDKARAPWKMVQERLLANDAHFLKKGEAMNEGGVLFGVDKAGNPLIADGGLEPIMTGMNYADSRKAVMGEKEKATGYELFPYVEPYSKSPEIISFERHTGHPVVKSKDGNSYREIWLDSGENDANIGFARVANFDPSRQDAYVHSGLAENGLEDRGVRRLLRVRT